MAPLTRPRFFIMRKTGKSRYSPWPRIGVLQNILAPVEIYIEISSGPVGVNPQNDRWPRLTEGPK